jgi:drug/metabolite transporter (DMT)-like permease
MVPARQEQLLDTRADQPVTSTQGSHTSGSIAHLLVPLVLGLLAAAFFAVSFVINRFLATGGGSWEWTAALRFLLVTPMFAVVVAARRGLPAVLRELRRRPLAWFAWSSVGFVVFYAPVSFAAATAPGWAVASTWQATIVCGMLAAPFLYSDHRRRIPTAALTVSLVILGGVALVQLGRASDTLPPTAIGGVFAVLVGAIAYPVGNRKTLVLAADSLDTWQRLLAMSIASLPAWLIVAAGGGIRHGGPSRQQLVGTLVVAVSSGLIATTLFFAATARVQHDPTRLAAVEATQAAEVALVAATEPVLLHTSRPGALAWAGIVVITAGVLGYTALGRRPPRPAATARKRTREAEELPGATS